MQSYNWGVVMYQLTKDFDVVVRVSDSTTVPRGHRFWDEYEEWLSSGNTPKPMDVISVESREREWRDAEIFRLKWLRERHQDEILLKKESTISNIQFTELLNYLEELRGWPQSIGFPVMENRPLIPGWISKYEK